MILDANHCRDTEYRSIASARRTLACTAVCAAILGILGLTSADEVNAADDAATALIVPMEPLSAEANADTFDTVVSLVHERIFDPALIADAWDEAVDRNREAAIAARDFDALATAINAQLATLNVSHTAFYPPTDPRYYQLLGIFSHVLNDHPVGALRTNDTLVYTGIGAEYANVDDAWFLRDVISGGPADYAGLLRGDEITHADGQPFHPIRSFLNKGGAVMNLTVRRTGANDEPVTVRITPDAIDPSALFESSITDSVRVIESDGTRFGYVRVRSYAGRQMHDAVEDALATEPLKSCDHLLLDVRGGWGGADPRYLRTFLKDIPQLEIINADGDRTTFDAQWRKPVSLLVDDTVRSGKEVLAYGFQEYSIGTVIGQRTGGAVVGGSPFLLDNNCVLYLAVVDVTVDGVRLEGNGVVPDVRIDDDFRYAQGKDAVIDGAVRFHASQNRDDRSNGSANEK